MQPANRFFLSSVRRIVATIGLVGVVMLALIGGTSASAFTPTPVWKVSQSPQPTLLPPGGTGSLLVQGTNLGSVATSGAVTMSAHLPDGVTAVVAGDGFYWECPEVGVTVTCSLNETFFPSVAAHESTPQVRILFTVDPEAAGTGESVVTVSGGGAAGAGVSRRTDVISDEPAGAGIADFDGWLVGGNGAPEMQAGAHPDFSTDIRFNTLELGGRVVPGGNVKDLTVDLPPGLLGNPNAVPRCDAELMFDPEASRCPPESQIGTVDVEMVPSGASSPEMFEGGPVYNVEPPAGVAARFAFNTTGVVTNIDAGVRTGGDYGATARVTRASQTIAIAGTRLTLWGVPADPSHDPQRCGPKCIQKGVPSSFARRALMVNPTSCPGTVATISAAANTWQDPSAFSRDAFDTDVEGSPAKVVGCDSIAFNPEFSVHPESPPKRGAPGGLGIEVSVPQNENPDGLATSHLRKAGVTLPEGMGINSSSVQGLEACTLAQIEIHGPAPARCPSAAKIGSVEVETPLLEETLQGGIYLASQRNNPFGSTLALYMVVEGSGVVLKLPGRIETDASSGQVTATFDDNPQLPFSKLSVHLKTGPRAPLSMPASCGPATTTAVLTPWSGGPAVTLKSSFDVSDDGNGGPCPALGFKPQLRAGTASPLAGAFSPFALQLSRSDEDGEFAAISSLTLPKGLVGKLAGIPYCSDSALAGIPTAELTGAAQIASPSCPASSQLGTVTVGAGAGSNPFYVNTGKAYLAGPYKGAPLSLAVVTPAVAGPFDLGNVVVRNALRVDPATAQINAVSDPLPRILHGIPLDLRDIKVDVNRDDFTLNPTSCNPMSVSGTVASTSGQSANVSDRFQVGSCERLAFEPSLKLKVSGATRRGAYPKLRAELKAKPGEANIAKVSVALPHSEFLAQEHIKTICTRVQYAADACPAGSIYGKATAWSPLLDQPLSGPVYLRSSSNPLPDLVVALKGQIDIDLAGRIDSVNGGIRNTFSLVPDAPVSKFVLEMQGGKKSLLVNSRNLCAKGAGKATVKMDGQNGKAHDFNPVLGTSCGKKARKKGR
jgi:hypothetical protein